MAAATPSPRDLSRNSLIVTALPTELLIEIFGSCDSFGDIVSLASSSKRLHETWTSFAPAIIWPMSLRCVTAFDYALMAVRATELVRCALDAGRMPPDLVADVEALSGARRAPNIAELCAVLDLQHLARCMEHFYREGSCLGDIWKESRAGGSEPPTPHDLPELDEWIENYRPSFSRAIYKILLVGAVLMPAHLGLVSAAGPGQPLDLRADLPQALFDTANDHKIIFEDDHNDDQDFPDTLAPDMVVYLQSCSAYKVTSTLAEKEALFGPFAAFLMRRAVLDMPECMAPHANKGYRFGLSLLQGFQEMEALRMITMKKLLLDTIVNEDGWMAHNRPLYDYGAYQYKAPEKPSRSVRIRVILPDVHKVEELLAPADPRESDDLIALRPAAQMETEPRALQLYKSLDLALLKEPLYARSGIPNYYDTGAGLDRDELAAPPDLHFFDFMVWRHMGLRISDDSRYTNWALKSLDHAEFLATAGVYRDDVTPGHGYRRFYKRLRVEERDRDMVPTIYRCLDGMS